MAELTIEQLQEELATVKLALEVSEKKNEEATKQLSFVEEQNSALKKDLEKLTLELKKAAKENLSLQKKAEKSESNSTSEPIVEIEGEKYLVLHGGSAFDKFKAFTVAEVVADDELAKALLEIGFGGLLKIEE